MTDKAVALLLCFATFKGQLIIGCLVLLPHVNTSCSTHCSCTVDRTNGTAARCDIRGMTPSALEQIRLPDDLFSLDLSSNGLKEIPKFLHKFPNMSVLSLANNSIFGQGSSFDELETLKYLRTLDISFTSERINSRDQYWRLRPWNLIKVLSSVEKIDITHTVFANALTWDDLLTSLPNIRQLIGVEWGRSCDLCNISKVDVNQTVQDPQHVHYNRILKKQDKNNVLQNKSKHSSTVRMFYVKGSTDDGDSGNICATSLFPGDLPLKWEIYYKLPKRYLSPGFMLQCYCSSSNCVRNEGFKFIPDIIRLLRHLFNSLYFTGSVAIILNLTVVVVVSTSETLLKSPTMILILNLAVSDLLMSVCCILAADYFKLLTAEEDFQTGLIYYHKFFSFETLKETCRSKMLIFTVAQNISVLTSLLVTVEKYLVIVYPLNPGRRMTKKHCLILLCTVWFVSIAYSVDAVFNLDKKTQTYNSEMFNYFYCSASGRHIHHFPISAEDYPKGKLSVPASVFIGFLYGFLFICTIPLYIHIYIVVKKSSTQMGVKREGVLAKKLALLVFTNLIFCVVPFSLAPILGSKALLILDLFNPLTRTYSSYQAYLIGFVWLPALLLSLNCCLNPLIFAFRYHRFETELRQLISNVMNRFRYCTCNYRKPKVENTKL